MQNDSKRSKIWKLRKCGIFYQLRFFKLRAKKPKFRYVGQISIELPIFERNFGCTLFRRCWFQIWHCFSKISSPNSKIWAFCVKKYQLSDLIREILHVPYFECADFKFDIDFRKFCAQFHKYGYFLSKVSSF